jgi:phosphatidate cytidylyltransferase
MSHKKPYRDLLKATGTGIVLGIVFLTSVFLFKPLFLLLVILIGIKAYMELGKLFKLPLYILSLCSTCVLIITYFLGLMQMSVYFIIVLFVLAIYSMVSNTSTPFLQKYPQIVFSFFYICLPLSLTILILNNKGHNYILFVVLTTICSDVGGYFIGSIFGKHKISKVISPNKTFEGLLGSIVFAIIFALSYTFFVWHINIILSILYAIFIALVVTFGDFCESLLKRSKGLKDLGTILQGHGGVLDRFDGLIIVLPLFYILINLV